MKTFFILLIALAPLISHAQEKLAKNGLPLNAKSIVIDATVPAEKVFSYLGAFLIDNGFEIKNSDKDLGIVQTNGRSVGNRGFFLRLSIHVDGQKIKMKGFLNMPRLSDSELENNGMKGSANLLTFSDMDKLAKSIPNSNVTYEF